VRIGVVADIHGNRTALEAVVADGGERGVRAWWAIGDLVAIGPEPVATLDLLTTLPGLVVTSGNTERYVLTGERPGPHPEEVARDTSLLGLFAAVEGSFGWTRGALASHGWLGWLDRLPLEARTELADGTRLLGVHASPGRDDGAGITPDRAEDELSEALVGADADIVLAGHTHQPTDRVVGAIRAINVGSVSNPITDDLRASYVIIYADRDRHRLEHRRVPYDRDRFLTVLRRSGHPEAAYIASFQSGEQTRFPARRPNAPCIEE